MAEIVEYRVQKSLDELRLLIEFGVFDKEEAKKITSERQNFEYALRRRTRTKLEYLKYIRFEVNLLESIEKYRKKVIADANKAKKSGNIEDVEYKIIMLQAKKMKEILRSRCAHISFLYRKLTTTFQFDKKLWMVYIEFAKTRKWNTRVSALYWRLLRISSDDPQIWVDAANHEAFVNEDFKTARNLFWRALRHCPGNDKIKSEYLKMEMEAVKKLPENEDKQAYLERRIKELDGKVSEQTTEFENGPKEEKKALKHSNLEILYECYDKSGIDATREMYDKMKKSMKSQTLSLYVAMIQVETWQMAKDKSESQLNRIRSIYDQALGKFGKTKPKLWYEYVQFENSNAKSLEDFAKVNEIYNRALATVVPGKVERIIEKYTIMRSRKTGPDVDYSDYSDLED